MTSLKRSVQTWAAGGAAIGTLFLAAGWIVGFAHSPDAPFAVMIADEPVLWVVTFTPIVLSVIGGLLGLALAQFGQTQGDTTELAERVAEGVTAAIHEHNVETVRTGSVQSKYFASLSHDIRTPLSAIIAFSAIVEDSDISHTLSYRFTCSRSAQAPTTFSRSSWISSTLQTRQWIGRDSYIRCRRRCSCRGGVPFFDHRLGTTGNVPQPTRGNVAAVTPRVHVTLDLHRRTSQTPWHRCRCA